MRTAGAFGKKPGSRLAYRINQFREIESTIERHCKTKMQDKINERKTTVSSDGMANQPITDEESHVFKDYLKR